VRIALVGIGAVGTRVARHLLADPDVQSLVLVHRDSGWVTGIVDSFVPLNRDSPSLVGPRVEIRTGVASEVPEDADVVVLTQPEGVREAAEIALARGANVVSTSDDPDEVRRLLRLDSEARRYGRTVAVGVAMAPGLSCVLATFGAQALDEVNQVHVCSLGTGGPACARRHHAALSSAATDWSNGEWHRRPGGSGRELVWFPEPAGGADCYRAGLIDPVLLVPAFPTAQKVTARLAATRRDRLTSWMPMLRRPHPEGRIGAVRVELRGRRGGVAEVRILGATSRPAVIAGAVSALAATWAGNGRFARSGAGGLAELVSEPGEFLRALHARGVRTVQFEGSDSDFRRYAASTPPGPDRPSPLPAGDGGKVRA